MYALGLTIKYTCSYRLDLQKIQGYPTLEIPGGGGQKAAQEGWDALEVKDEVDGPQSTSVGGSHE